MFHPRRCETELYSLRGVYYLIVKRTKYRHSRGRRKSKRKTRVINRRLWPRVTRKKERK